MKNNFLNFVINKNLKNLIYLKIKFRKLKKF